MANRSITIHAATFGAASPLPNTEGQAVEFSREVEIAAGAGDKIARAYYTVEAAAALELRTLALHTLLGQLTLPTAANLVPSASLATKNAVVYFAANLPGAAGTFAASGHQSFTYSKGVAFLSQLTLGGRAASATLRCLAASTDGDAEPYARSASATLPVITGLQSEELYRIESVVVGGVTLSRWGDVTLSIDPKPRPIRAPGKNLWPTNWELASEGMVDIDLTIQSDEIDELWAEQLAVGRDARTTTIVLARLEKAGTLASGAKITLTHIGSIDPAQQTGDRQQDASTSVTSRATWDGTNYPLTLALGI